MKKAIRKRNKIELDIAVHRDKSYYKSWKGNVMKSGGIVFNLGIHYFDLAYWLAGENKVEVKCNLTTRETKKKARRIIKINGKEFNLSAKENLSEENLHRFVYKDLIEDRGVRARDLLKLVKLLSRDEKETS